MEDQLTQTALLEQDELINFMIEPITNRSLVGNIYKGIVQNVLPGMQAAFINIGLSKNAFIYIDDLLHPNQDKHPTPKPTISDVVKPGDQLIVQVVKDPYAKKGARVSTHFNLAGRWLVFLPTADYIGISRKVTIDLERERLKQLASKLIQEGEGVILRTAANGESVDALKMDVQRLRTLWQSIVEKYDRMSAPALLHTEVNLLERIFRDFYTTDVQEIWVSSKSLEADVRVILNNIATQQLPEIYCYLQPMNKLITQFAVNKKVVDAFDRKIPLQSGGYLIWEETEALTVIDVNTGKFVGHNNLEETLLQTNSEAAKMIARLLRIRDTGGIIIIDFIDMENEESKAHIFKLMQHYLKEDGTKSALFGWTKLGLMEMTRKKTRDRYTEKYLKQYELK